jgi:thiosulfate reductase cytochrome b subunit
MFGLRGRLGSPSVFCGVRVAHFLRLGLEQREQAICRLNARQRISHLSIMYIKVREARKGKEWTIHSN